MPQTASPDADRGGQPPDQARPPARDASLREQVLVPVALAALAKLVLLLGTYILLDRPDDFIHRLAWQWDGTHYLNAARDGYQKDLDGPGTSVAFAFLYPLLIRLLGGGELAALAIANAAALAAVGVVAWHWGRRAGLALALFPPWLVYGTVAYSEGLYVLLAALALAAIERRWQVRAGIAAAAAASARYFGGPALLLASVPWRRWREPSAWRGFALLAVAGVALFAWTVHQTGDPRGYIAAQRHDFADTAWPWEHFDFVLHGWYVAQGGPVAPWGNLSSIDFFTRDVAYTAVLLAGLAFLWRDRAPASTLVYTAFAILTAYCVIGMPAMALPRYLLAAFPAIGALGARIDSRLGWGLYGLLGMAFALHGLSHHLFAYWS